MGLHHDIGRFCAQLAENNINDVVEQYDKTYTSCSFEAIINQAMYQMGGYEWEYASSTFISEGIQEKILVTRRKGS